MGVIIERLFESPTVEQGLYYDFPVKVRHFYIPILVFIFFRMIVGYNITVSFLLSLIAFAYVFYTHHTFRVYKRQFLENLMYNSEIEPYNIQSYLNMDDDLVDFWEAMSRRTSMGMSWGGVGMPRERRSAMW